MGKNRQGEGNRELCKNAPLNGERQRDSREGKGRKKREKRDRGGDTRRISLPSKWRRKGGGKKVGLMGVFWGGWGFLSKKKEGGREPREEEGKKKS